jgi:hypothetical protein
MVDQIVIGVFASAGTAFMLFVLVGTQRDLNRLKKRSGTKEQKFYSKLSQRMGFGSRGQFHNAAEQSPSTTPSPLRSAVLGHSH